MKENLFLLQYQRLNKPTDFTRKIPQLENDPAVVHAEHQRKIEIES